VPLGGPSPMRYPAPATAPAPPQCGWRQPPRTCWSSGLSPVASATSSEPSISSSRNWVSSILELFSSSAPSTKQLTMSPTCGSGGRGGG
jgi:hypothetical protein